MKITLWLEQQLEQKTITLKQLGVAKSKWKKMPLEQKQMIIETYTKNNFPDRYLNNFEENRN